MAARETHGSHKLTGALLGAALLLSLVPATGMASALTGHAYDRGELQHDVNAIHDTGATGVLGEVLTDGGRLTARAGVADLARKKQVPWNAYNRIGSDTKTFTATIALQLVGEGRLRLTDTVERWLPGLVRGNGNDGRKITVKNLLRHTSGLHDYTDELLDPETFTPEEYVQSRFRVHTPKQQVALAMRRAPGWTPDPANPAEERRWAYSNTNYVLAGLIIEKVTGQTWDQQVHQRVIEPLGLRDTLTPGTSAYVPQPRATAYTRFPGRREFTDTTLAVGGGADGGVISTPHDLATFLRALMGGRLLRPAQLAQMKESVPVRDWVEAPGVRYGLGIAWRPAGGCDRGLWFHGGTGLGMSSESGVSPNGRRAAVVAVSSLRLDAGQRDQDRAALRLVDNALCR